MTTAPAHLQAQAYRYRRFRRWVGMLIEKFGYSVPILAQRLQTTEAVIRGEAEPRDVIELWRLWSAASKLVAGPAVWDQADEAPSAPLGRDPKVDAKRRKFLRDHA
jgi:hypothetical protein